MKKLSFNIVLHGLTFGSEIATTPTLKLRIGYCPKPSLYGILETCGM